MKILVPFLGVLVLLCACSSNQRVVDNLDGWLGKSETELVSALGAPKQSYKTKSGETILTFEKTVYGFKDRSHLCVKSFVLDRNGVVTNGKARGCSD